MDRPLAEPKISRALTAVLALLIGLGSAEARVSCGDTLNGAPHALDVTVRDLSRGRLAAELTHAADLPRDAPLRALIERTTAAERTRRVREADRRPAADGRLCWSRRVALAFADERVASVVMSNAVEVEKLGRPVLWDEALLYDRRTRRRLALGDLFREREPAFAALQAAAIEALIAEKRERGIAVEGAEKEPFERVITPDEAGLRNASLRPKQDGAGAAGLVFSYGSGALGSRLEHTYELFVPAERFAAWLKPEWQALFGAR
jgi:hypothetical protein